MVVVLRGQREHSLADSFSVGVANWLAADAGIDWNFLDVTWSVTGI